MGDFNLLRQIPPGGLFAPYGCMICGGNKTPLLDLCREFGPGLLRLYCCEIHGKEIARDFGFVKGDEMDELLRVRDQLLHTEREMAEVNERYEALGRDVKRLLSEDETLRSELARSRQREAQLQEQLTAILEAGAATKAATQHPVEEDDYEPAID